MTVSSFKSALLTSAFLTSTVIVAALPCAAQTGAAQMGANDVTPAAPIREDARSHLKAGFRDAGQAAWNMDLVINLPKPDGFFDPEAPAGKPAPQRPANPAPAAEGTGGGANAAPPAPRPPQDPSKIGVAAPSFTDSDLAFSNNRVIMGNYHGFLVYDVTSQDHPKLAASVVCPGAQGDVSVYGNLLFLSVQDQAARLDCGAGGATGLTNKDRFRGVRIFDISNLNNPRQVAAVQTCRGSHTHTVVPDRHDPRVVYVYNQGTSAPRTGDEMAGCSGKEASEDPHTSLYSIDVIKVPLDAPEKAAIVDSPRIFANADTGELAGLQKRGKQGENGQTTMGTNHCHDITVYTDLDIAAGACSGNGILFSIADPSHPFRLDAEADPNFAYWHAAVFNNDGTKVVYTDEWGGGAQPRCRLADPANWGGDIVFDIVDHKLVPRAHYKMPSAQTELENCVAHNGGLIPVPGRDIMVQAWYQGGTSVMDFTDSRHPVEIAYFDRGPINGDARIDGGHWSSYWYKGRIYASEIARGLDVFKLKPSEYLTKNEIAAADLITTAELNPQSQHRLTWPDSPVVARAYLDQLVRGKAISQAKAQSVTKALDDLEKHRAKAGAFKALADDLTKDADAAQKQDGERMRNIARILSAAA